MKKLVEELGEGMEKLLGERITIFCVNYIYTGKLEGISDDCVLLKDAAIVYETGPLDSATWRNSEALPGDWYVQIGAIESFGLLK